MIECPDCEGRGAWLIPVAWSGEGWACDQQQVECEGCDGTGEIEGDE